MKKKGYSSSTLKFVSKALKFLNDNCNLNDPESVKEFIAKYDSANSYKRNLCYAYSHYLKWNGLSWNSPKYRVSSKLPKIPTEETLNMIISASPPLLALRLSISKETGLRPIELCNLRVRDIDLVKGIIYPNTAKGVSLCCLSSDTDFFLIYILRITHRNPIVLITNTR
jgi:integrase